jgi:valyl-tRNA synthetase
VQERAKKLLEQNIKFIQKDCNIEAFEYNDEDFINGVIVPLIGGKLSIDFSGAIDVDAERDRLQKELEHVAPYIAQLEAKLAGDFASNAPPAIVDKERQKLAEAKEKHTALEHQLKSIM